eukprot:TRINITY_DN3309_c0_g1_i3.p1 TRINITY_DN3309_c0_g1~~TRINITY_DN3309_c0_g1_i3.p1  ORF type:complete len:544 (-),score=139.32 TRINITY_DN3309_c0_g1_i3:445-2076(-)
MNKAEYLVVDSGGFIKNAPLRELGQHLVTLREVIDEIRDKPTRQRLKALPYELEYRQPSSEGLRVVTEFSKKTGDYPSLSAVDLMVLAVAYDLEAEKCGTAHLNKEPKVQKTVEFYQPSKGISEGDKKIAGFYTPTNGVGAKEVGEELSDANTTSRDENFSTFQFWREPIADIPLDLDFGAADISATEPSDNNKTAQCSLSTEELENLNSFLTERSFICDYNLSQVDTCVANLIDENTSTKYSNIQRWFKHIKSYTSASQEKHESLNLELIFARINDGFDFSVEDVMGGADLGAREQHHADVVSSDEGVVLNDSDKENEDYEGDDDDDDGWITPSNIKEKKNLMSGETAEEKRVDVACITTDFAMQNVLKQIGLNILGTNGMIIRETKTWILRCYACFRTTPLLDKKFCPKCGNKTLKRVSVTLNADGSQDIHISTRRPLTSRGKKFSLPAPVGGKHGTNPKLCEDQREAQQRLSKKAVMRNNPLDPDWIAGSSPFATKDVTSKSAMLGLRGEGRGQAQQGGQYWAQKNPNSGRKSTGSKRRK